MAAAFLIKLDQNHQLPANYTEQSVIFWKIVTLPDMNYLAIQFSFPKQDSEVETFFITNFRLKVTIIHAENLNTYIKSQKELFITRIPSILDRCTFDKLIMCFVVNEKVKIAKKCCYYSIISINEDDLKRLFLFLPSIPFLDYSMLVSFTCLDFPILRFSNFPVAVDIRAFLQDQLKDITILELVVSNPKRLQKEKYANVLFDSFDVLPNVINIFNLQKVEDRTIYVNRFIEPQMKETVQKSEVCVRNLPADTDKTSFFTQMSKFGQIYRISYDSTENGFAGYVIFCQKDSADKLIDSQNYSASFSMVYVWICNFPPDTQIDDVEKYLADIGFDNSIESVIQYDNQETNLTLPSFIVQVNDHSIIDDLIEQLSYNDFNKQTIPYGLYWSPHKGDNTFDDKGIILRLFGDDDNMIAIFPIVPKTIHSFFEVCSKYGVVTFLQSCSHTDPPLLIVRYQDEEQCQEALNEINGYFFDGILLTARTFQLDKRLEDIINDDNVTETHSRKKKEKKKDNVFPEYYQKGLNSFPFDGFDMNARFLQNCNGPDNNNLFPPPPIESPRALKPDDIRRKSDENPSFFDDDKQDYVYGQFIGRAVPCRGGFHDIWNRVIYPVDVRNEFIPGRGGFHDIRGGRGGFNVNRGGRGGFRGGRCGYDGLCGFAQLGRGGAYMNRCNGRGRGGYVCTTTCETQNFHPDNHPRFQEWSQMNGPPQFVPFSGQPRTLNADSPVHQMDSRPPHQEQQRIPRQERQNRNEAHQSPFRGTPRTLNNDNEINHSNQPANQRKPQQNNSKKRRGNRKIYGH